MLIAQHYPGTRFCECGAAMQECQSVTYMPVYVCQKCGRHEPKGDEWPRNAPQEPRFIPEYVAFSVP